MQFLRFVFIGKLSSKNLFDAKNTNSIIFNPIKIIHF